MVVRAKCLDFLYPEHVAPSVSLPSSLNVTVCTCTCVHTCVHMLYTDACAHSCLHQHGAPHAWASGVRKERRGRGEGCGSWEDRGTGWLAVGGGIRLQGAEGVSPTQASF